MTLLDWLHLPALLTLAVSWVLSIASIWELVRNHRAEGRGMGHYLEGSSWFGPEAFAPSGAATRRRLHGALLVFFGTAFGWAIATVIGSAMAA